MKVIIPLAGKGTRLRPHTHVTPKPLLRVGGRPVMSYILDDLQAIGVDEIVFIKFHDSDHSRAWRAPHTAFHDTSRPDATIRESYEFRGFAFFSRGR